MDYSSYSSILFIDSMIPLEAKPIPQLPWAEIDSIGPVLVLIVPQVNKEVDKKKRDGRLGKKLRDFNRLIEPAALAAQPQKVVDGTPEVFVGIAICDRIDWDALDDLDPDEGDAKVVAQILAARGVPLDRKILLTQDTNPIAMAARHDLSVRKLPPHWIMDAEPSPDEREKAKLRARVSELEANELQFDLKIDFPIPSPVKIRRVQPLDAHERSALVAHILDNNPPRQNSSGFMSPRLRTH